MTIYNVLYTLEDPSCRQDFTSLKAAKRYARSLLANKDGWVKIIQDDYPSRHLSAFRMDPEKPSPVWWGAAHCPDSWRTA